MAHIGTEEWKKMDYNYQLTKYPKIFDNVYWGHFKFEPDEDETKEIINNRNEFIEEFSIVRQKKILVRHLKKLHKQGFPTDIFDHSNEMSGLVDHRECYYTGKVTRKHILIYSPYCKNEDEITEFFVNYGFNEYKPLYAGNARTFVRVFDA